MKKQENGNKINIKTNIKKEETRPHAGKVGILEHIENETHLHIRLLARARQLPPLYGVVTQDQLRRN